MQILHLAHRIVIHSCAFAGLGQPNLSPAVARGLPAVSLHYPAEMRKIKRYPYK